MIVYNCKKAAMTFPILMLDANEPNKPLDPQLINTLERYHNNHVNKDCRAYKLLDIFWMSICH
jgi:hypothetical protein